MHAINVVRGAAYATSGSYANAYRIAEVIRPDRQSVGLSEIRALVEQRIDELNLAAAKRPVSQAVAQAALLARDLARIGETIASLDPSFADEEQLRHRFGRLVEAARRQGFTLADPELHIVNDFPGPYAGSEGWAMNLDVSDERAYGVKPGIYLRQSLLMPMYTDFLAAHELVHAICGQQDSDYLARGLEDGLGDVFGSLHLAAEAVDPRVCRQMLLNSRVLFPQTQFWSIYGDALHQALLLHDLCGIAGLRDTLHKANTQGRGAIKDVEEALLTDASADLVRTAPQLDHNIAAFSRAYRATMRSLVVSPLAYYLAERVELGGSTEVLIADLEVEPRDGRAALKELQERVFLVFVENGEVWADETKLNLRTGALRYELISADD